jgi:hypothetical protein
MSGDGLSNIVPTSAGGTGIASTATFPSAGTVATTSQLTTFFSVIGRQVFTSTSTYTPTSGTKYCDIEILGGGGGGGGAAASATGSSAGAAGGAGAYLRKIYPVATVTGLTMTVGNGGAGGAAGDNVGTAGGFSLIGSLVEAVGGGGGNGGANAAPTAAFVATLGGLGGAQPSGGDINAPGQAGGDSFVFSGCFVGGAGGSSIYGAGARCPVPNLTQGTFGLNALVYGSGGSGGVDLGSNTSRAGGNGSSGICIVTEYG